MMEPITATLTTAKEIYEAAKTIQKVYNVTKEMKTVAESEGTDQIMATKDFASTAKKMQQEGLGGKGEKSESSNKEIKNEGDLYHGDVQKPDLLEGAFVHELDTAHTIEKPLSESVEFVDKIPELEPYLQNQTDNVFVDRLSSSEMDTSKDLNIAEKNNFADADCSSKEVAERDPNRFSEKNQYADGERCQEYRNNPNNEPLLEGYEKDANVLRRNMELVMGDDASEIDKSNSRAHHIVGDNEYSSESKAILDKYGIDINAPENGIFLPQNESSDLHGTIHDGKHTKAYNDEVTQRLRAATCKEDVLEILDSIKEDLYNGDMELYHDHKYND